MRSALEYGSASWDPYLKGSIKQIELVQNRAMRWIEGLPPFDRTHIKTLQERTGLDSLEDRRRDARLGYMFRVMHGRVGVGRDQLNLVLADSRRTGHALKLKHKGGKNDPLKHLFVRRTIPQWKTLPAATAEAGDLDSFKAQLAAARHP